MKRKFLVILLAGVMVMSLTACGNSELDAEIQRLQEQIEQFEEQKDNTVRNNPPSDTSATVEEATERYLKAVIFPDYDTLNKYSALNFDVIYSHSIQYANSEYSISESEIKEWLSNEFGSSDVKSVFEKQAKDEFINYWTETFGSDYNITVNIFEVRELPATEMNEILDKLWNSSYYDYDMGINRINKALKVNGVVSLENITAISVVEGRVSITGSINSESNSFTAMCVKINDAWKVLSDEALVPFASILLAVEGVSESKKLKVPELIGMSYDDAVHIYDWLNLEKNEQYSNQYPVGVITWQGRHWGVMINPYEIIYLTVSKGENPNPNEDEAEEPVTFDEVGYYYFWWF